MLGDTQTCVQRIGDDHSHDDIRPLLAEFCGVEKSTVGRWLNGRNLPVGEPLIKLRVLLEVAGYNVSEMGELKKSLRELAQIIGFGIISLDEVRRRLDYSQTQEVYRLVLNGSGMVPKRVRRLEMLLDEHRSKIDKQRTIWSNRLDEVIGTSERPAPSSMTRQSTAPSTNQVASVVTVPSFVVNHTVEALIGMLDTLDYVSDQAVTRRRELAAFIGSDRLDDLIDRLERLARL